MKVFISYHRADTKQRELLEEILDENDIDCYAVPQNMNLSGLNHQIIKDRILSKMSDCDAVICLVGTETYTRGHVDWELHEALKGGAGYRKGIVAVLLETREDNKNDIDYETFPARLTDNEDYIVIEQFASFHQRVLEAIDEAVDRSRNKNYLIDNKRKPMQLRSKLYYDNYINYK